ncbi:hypothetical protein PI95_026325 [Hassallia byssoidea VB512170]|uniref:Uncharacterized protein n=1 Tax=Hassallia byssoidea VB512170 TaxID=1304833 RepID=A0A846HF58_9CYAN|nr:hypothetical protein [Hassalia byssoidea]NEU75972.1 hypothetical protein [Hassalia byssoidea VB512170]
MSAIIATSCQTLFRRSQPYNLVQHGVNKPLQNQLSIIHIVAATGAIAPWIDQ